MKESKMAFLCSASGLVARFMCFRDSAGHKRQLDVGYGFSRTCQVVAIICLACLPA